MTIRAFIAVPLPTPVRQALDHCVRRLRETPAIVKWVAPADLHVTLKFLGAVDERDTPSIARKLASMAAQQVRFAAEVRGLGAFPDVGRPRTVWAGFAVGREAFVDLGTATDHACEELGFATEHRRFHPHITLGRVKSGESNQSLAELLNLYLESAFGQFDVKELQLISSTLSRHGPAYTPLATIPLAPKS